MSTESLPALPIRVGNGFDVHRFAPDRDLWLCGVKIDSPLGLLGHSDADVALHALADALLGAVALRDIGYHFPDTDPAYKGADSRVLLRRVVEIIASTGYRPVQVDLTIIAQAPKL
ncbi:MAG: 2-C-methyl-D-erythritol 2,4-cyclodiphosphate synthase, partial [Muribaculaceae bacterium]|nr:2-C-methyl-D-erythritol 2,4-cyclodiphosphate synthase [Muribaculaceae bacterium]